MINANPQTRTIEDSLREAHMNLNAAQSLVAGISADLNGSDSAASGDHGMAPGGLVDQADRLAGRAVSLVNALQLIRERISTPKVVSLAQSDQAQAFRQNLY